MEMDGVEQGASQDSVFTPFTEYINVDSSHLLQMELHTSSPGIQQAGKGYLTNIEKKEVLQLLRDVIQEHHDQIKQPSDIDAPKHNCIMMNEQVQRVTGESIQLVYTFRRRWAGLATKGSTSTQSEYSKCTALVPAAGGRDSHYRSYRLLPHKLVVYVHRLDGSDSHVVVQHCHSQSTRHSSQAECALGRDSAISTTNQSRETVATTSTAGQSSDTVISSASQFNDAVTSSAKVAVASHARQSKDALTSLDSQSKDTVTSSASQSKDSGAPVAGKLTEAVTSGVSCLEGNITSLTSQYNERVTTTGNQSEEALTSLANQVKVAVASHARLSDGSIIASTSQSKEAVTSGKTQSTDKLQLSEDSNAYSCTDVDQPDDSMKKVNFHKKLHLKTTITNIDSCGANTDLNTSQGRKSGHAEDQRPGSKVKDQSHGYGSTVMLECEPGFGEDPDCPSDESVGEVEYTSSCRRTEEHIWRRDVIVENKHKKQKYEKTEKSPNECKKQVNLCVGKLHGFNQDIEYDNDCYISPHPHSSQMVPVHGSMSKCSQKNDGKRANKLDKSQSKNGNFHFQEKHMSSSQQKKIEGDVQWMKESQNGKKKTFKFVKRDKMGTRSLHLPDIASVDKKGDDDILLIGNTEGDDHVSPVICRHDTHPSPPKTNDISLTEDTRRDYDCVIDNGATHFSTAAELPSSCSEIHDMLFEGEIELETDRDTENMQAWSNDVSDADLMALDESHFTEEKNSQIKLQDFAEHEPIDTSVLDLHCSYKANHDAKVNISGEDQANNFAFTERNRKHKKVICDIDTHDFDNSKEEVLPWPDAENSNVSLEEVDRHKCTHRAVQINSEKDCLDFGQISASIKNGSTKAVVHSPKVGATVTVTAENCMDISSTGQKSTGHVSPKQKTLSGLKFGGNVSPKQKMCGPKITGHVSPKGQISPKQKTGSDKSHVHRPKKGESYMQTVCSNTPDYQRKCRNSQSSVLCVDKGTSSGDDETAESDSDLLLMDSSAQKSKKPKTTSSKIKGYNSDTGSTSHCAEDNGKTEMMNQVLPSRVNKLKRRSCHKSRRRFSRIEKHKNRNKRLESLLQELECEDVYEDSDSLSIPSANFVAKRVLETSDRILDSGSITSDTDTKSDISESFLPHGTGVFDGIDILSDSAIPHVEMNTRNMDSRSTHKQENCRTKTNTIDGDSDINLKADTKGANTRTFSSDSDAYKTSNITSTNRRTADCDSDAYSEADGWSTRSKADFRCTNLMAVDQYGDGYFKSSAQNTTRTVDCNTDTSSKLEAESKGTRSVDGDSDTYSKLDSKGANTVTGDSNSDTFSRQGDGDMSDDSDSEVYLKPHQWQKRKKKLLSCGIPKKQKKQKQFEALLDSDSDSSSCSLKRSRVTKRSTFSSDNPIHIDSVRSCDACKGGSSQDNFKHRSSESIKAGDCKPKKRKLGNTFAVSQCNSKQRKMNEFITAVPSESPPLPSDENNLEILSKDRISTRSQAFVEQSQTKKKIMVAQEQTTEFSDSEVVKSSSSRQKCCNLSNTKDELPDITRCRSDSEHIKSSNSASGRVPESKETKDSLKAKSMIYRAGTFDLNPSHSDRDSPSPEGFSDWECLIDDELSTMPVEVVKIEDTVTEKLQEEIQEAGEVSDLNEEQLQFLVSSNEKYLRDIFQGKVPCRRHEDYKSGPAARKNLKYQVPLGLYHEEQHDLVMDMLIKIFCSKHHKYLDYVMKVMLPEMLVKIYMEVHQVTHADAETTMAAALTRPGGIVM